MSVPSSSDELLQLIRKSGMIDDPKLNNYLSSRSLPPDPREAADALIRDGLLTYFQAEQFLLGKWRGFTVGKYKLLERVGVGGMGQVFLCEHMFMKRRVAIKVLPPAKAEQPAALGRFYREARAAGLLEHPHIVRTHDIDQDENLHFIVMEYVEGSNLLDVVKKFGPLDIGRAIHYMRQVAVGLDYAFRSGIIHRDIKPGNILIDKTGTAKILDMGLARFYHDQHDQLTIKYDDKIVLGTADYVAPEQVANSHAVDVRADIYALGASLYFLLTGHPPFPSGTVSQKLLWHRTKDPTPVRQVRPEVPEGLSAIVAKMMAKDPSARYQTPADVAAELKLWEPETILAPAPQEMPQLSPAAAEVLKSSEPAEDSIAKKSGVVSARLTRTTASGPIAAPPRASGPLAVPSRSSGPLSVPARLSGPIANPGRSVFGRSGPFQPQPRTASPPPGPFAAVAQVDIGTNNAAAHENTPADGKPLTLEPVFPAGIFAVEPPPPRRTGLWVGLTVAITMLIIAVCVMWL